ncbi:DM13 domain-containing protein [Marivirga sp. S37H4]|uniref:DM13 domain-containing protein n=1 Tax=Marivirga aurantiaca TaxID=2802615 RepID=A0A934X1H0_9BACT|nr:DM13 domain-containing protein [Marivirga aurantiaca]MBK6266581.1 DM13 domain-containing protein [Marivirga aurantiaca]
MKKIIVLAFLAIPFLFCSCDDTEVETMVVDTSLPHGDFMVVTSGQFMAQNGTPTAGSVEIGTDSEDEAFVRFSNNFMTELGTGTVTVYLSTTNEDLNEVFSPENGNQNLQLVGIVQRNGEHFFKLNSSIDAKYTHVILWCASAGIPFGNAELM